MRLIYLQVCIKATGGNLDKQLCRCRSLKGRGSSVGIATRLRAGRSRIWASIPAEATDFPFSITSRPAMGLTQPPIQWVQGTISPGVKRQWREADHSPLSSA
jgi:hypothetical protein